MDLVDFILNLVGLLLWFNWRSGQLDPLNRTSPATLAGTLKRTAPPRLSSWLFLTGLVLFLVLRAVLYRGLGSPAGWTPRLDLGLIVPAFRSDFFRRALTYSVLSFARVLIVFYFWLLVLALINRNTSEPDAIQRLIRLHLGRIGRWSWPVQLLLAPLCIAGLWLALHPLLVHLDVVNRARSLVHLAAQGLLVGSSIFFTLKYLLPAFLLLYLLASYIYLGNSPVWDFIGTTSRHLLAPLGRLPLRLARVDLTPVLGVLLILFLLHWLPNLFPALVSKLAHRNVAFWPQ